jgi:hypothetical protein
MCKNIDQLMPVMRKVGKEEWKSGGGIEADSGNRKWFDDVFDCSANAAMLGNNRSPEPWADMCVYSTHPAASSIGNRTWAHI